MKGRREGRRLALDINRLIDAATAVEAVEAADTVEELFAAAWRFYEGRGFDHLGIGQLVNPATADNDSTTDLSELYIGNFPDDFMREWLESRLVFHDPVTRYAANARNIFEWAEAYRQARKFGKLVFDFAADHELVDGLAVPVSIPRMPPGLVTLPHTRQEFSRDELFELELVGIHTYTRFLRLRGVAPTARGFTLTARETEILHYVAGGKTNWEISRILGVGETTVKFHLKNMNTKMSATNRAHAVMLGVRNGELLP